ncbi:MAG TPA: tetratricopeptide repeat protein, partial [Vicinamibacterales bacterium]
VTRRTRERAYDELHLPTNGVLSRATVIKVGEIVGANELLDGDVTVAGDSLTITAHPVRIDIGHADPPVVEQGDLQNLFEIARRVARRAVPGGFDPPLTPAPPLQAFEQYVKGILAEQPAAQAEFLDAAIRLDPHYDRARLALWDVRTAQGDSAAALDAVRDVAPDSGDAGRARFLSSVSLVLLKRYDEAFNVLKGLDSAAADPAVFNNLGVVQVRRGGPTDAGKPVYFLTQAAQAAPDDADILFNLGYAYALDRDPQAAMYWLREALRRNPEDGDAHYVLAAALDASGRTVEAARERELAGQLSARWAETRRPPPAGNERSDARETVPRGLERLREDLEIRNAAAADRALANTAQQDQQNVAAFHLDRARRLYSGGQDTQAIAELKRAVFLSPYDADAHLLIGRIYLRDARPREAVDALKISVWSKDSAPARIALADAYLKLKDLASARTEATRALALDPESAEAKAMLARIERGGQ